MLSLIISASLLEWYRQAAGKTRLPEMSCHTCFRAPASRQQFLCSTCARNQLYQLRLENARILLEKESIAHQIEAVVRHNAAQVKGLGDPAENTAACGDCLSTQWSFQIMAKKKAESSLRMKSLASRTENLISEINGKRLNVSQRRLTLARRYSDSESAQYQLGDREDAMLAGFHNNIKRTDHLWHSLHNKTAEARIFLCREAANLYGLRQRTKNKEGALQEAYIIGGATPAHISTYLFYVAHLLVLISHYMSLRLPAEITLPHKDYPSPTICAPSASYLSRGAWSASYSDHQSPPILAVLRTADPSRLRRSRPLFIDKSLPKLAREDHGTYALFLEGVTLLAWNVSWLCRTQGLNLSSDSWEEVCNIGKNMWQLLVAPPTRPSTLLRAFAGRDIQTKMRISKDSPRTTIQRTMSFPMLGHYSHGTAHSFLGATEGAEFVRTWKLPTPIKVADKLKSTLLGEMASAEWELLEGDSDDTGQEPTQSFIRRPSFTAGPHLHKGSTSDSLDSTVPDAETWNGPSSPAARLKGTSGWTKLRNR
ncbi:hypothetical protein BO70DRAFT_389650 [Aspergillus heteromorphus CBS 117.55]|uniref:Autophagy-related protein 14 n=1 Tax=Aspergillus heteromorphus CBS 117.55 TaxID=1448321 RepID=A0A317VAV5_9EURO|nr:uncharacterized protein BO70DRAFT_389650 [Aspergillus heteromorphus CBS 117.55]PWY71484.1 hypothetical protein BO70DRAFT_389650 [Aspergillus heteromorphus CBS 117.55]